MKRRFFWFAIGLLLAATVAFVFRLGPFGNVGASRQPGGKLQVTASFYTMAEFARQVGGDKVQVATLIKPGVEPHDYDPTPRDIAGIYESQVFIYNGAGLETWANRLRPDVESNGVVSVAASDGINLLTSNGETQSSGPGAGQGSQYYDPHVWLDPVLAQQEVDSIRDGLIAADPANRETYAQNAAAYNQQLAQLDQEFRSGLAGCQRKDIVTSHAFRYLPERYGLDEMAISGISPNEEPSPQKLAEIAAFARENDVHYIFFETLVSPRLADTIAGEIGAQTLVFNPLEGLTQEQIDQGANYISIQKENLANLRIALGCS